MKKRGFTLIEVVIYIALFSLLLGTAFVTAYQLIFSGDELDDTIVILSEGNFIQRKISWIFTGLDPTRPPEITGANCAQTIKVYKTNLEESPTIIKLTNLNKTKYIEINKKGGAFYTINTNNIKINCLNFNLTSDILSATATISNSNREFPFTINKLLLQ